MAYYISASDQTQPIVADDTEAGTVPTADIYVCIGGAGLPVANMSRDSICRVLQSIENYIRSDDPRSGGANVLAGLTS